MAGVFDTRNLAQQAQQNDTEITLTPVRLLGIFVVLAALCALCFGLGYSSGRRSPGDSAASPASGSTSVQADSGQPKPSANPQVGTGAKASAGQPDSTTSDDDSQAVGDPPNAQPQVKPALGGANPPQPAQAPVGSVTPALAQVAQIMVQIAEVGQQEDADVLVSAIRRRGYAVSARREPLDGLIHVKIGPFKTPAEADGWRQKLLNDGYNAEIQQ